MNNEKLKLNIGCGYNHFPGFINIDNDPNCKPDFNVELDDVNIRLPFNDSTFGVVTAFHVLEHIGAGFIPLLQEIYRVCEPDARVLIKVPYPRHDVQLIDPTHVRTILPETFRLFSKEHNRKEIESGGSSSCLGIKYDVDFEIVGYDFLHDSFYDKIIPTLTELERSRLFREVNNLTIESQVELRVVKEK